MELIDYFNGDELAVSVWKNKYALDSENSPDEMHRRMAREFYKIEQNYIQYEPDVTSADDDALMPNLLSAYGYNRTPHSEDSIYELFKDFKYIIPQGSVMSQLGSDRIGSLSNCFVIGEIIDSYGGIFIKDQEMAQLMKRRGGVGTDISTLRPKGTRTSNAAKTSTGAVSFMHRLSNTTREVAQNGRRGALMVSMDINHPDIMDFIKIKRDLTQVTGANISIKLNREFMDAVKRDDDYLLRFPCNTDVDISYPDPSQLEYGELLNVVSDDPKKICVIKKIRAKEYWDELIKSAHGVAEPGLMFWDTMIEYSPDGVYSQYRAIGTNPCVIGNTLLLTNLGWMKIKTLYDLFGKNKTENITIVTIDKFNKFTNSKLTDVLLTEKDAKIFKIEFDNGEHLLVNAKHKFYDIDFNEIIGIDSIDKQVISGEGIATIINVTELEYTEDVYDITAIPNFNFFSILNREETYRFDDIIINDTIKYKPYDLVETNLGQCFAKNLTMEHELI